MLMVVFTLELGVGRGMVVLGTEFLALARGGQSSPAVLGALAAHPPVALDTEDVLAHITAPGPPEVRHALMADLINQILNDVFIQHGGTGHDPLIQRNEGAEVPAQWNGIMSILLPNCDQQFEQWPTEGPLIGSFGKRPFVQVVRVHAGGGLCLLPPDTQLRRVPETQHTLAGVERLRHVVHSLGANRGLAVTAQAGARRVYGTLSGDYGLSESETVLFQQLHSVLGAAPSPIHSQEERLSEPRMGAHSVYDSLDYRRSGRRGYDPRRCLVKVIQGWGSPITEWNKQTSVQVWHLRVVECWESGSLGSELGHMLESTSPAELFAALRVVMVEVAGTRSPELGRSLNDEPQRTLIHAKFDAAVAMVEDAYTAGFDAHSGPVKTEFLAGFSVALIAMRAGMYNHGGVDDQARKELRRVVTVIRPDAMEDEEWLVTSLHRLKSWRLLLNTHVMGLYHSELHRYLTNVAEHIKSDNMRAHLMNLANEHLMQIAQQFGYRHPRQLPGLQDVAVSTALPMAGRRSSAAHDTRVISSLADLSMLHNAGQQLKDETMRNPQIRHLGVDFQVDFIAKAVRHLAHTSAVPAGLGKGGDELEHVLHVSLLADNTSALPSLAAPSQTNVLDVGVLQVAADTDKSAARLDARMRLLEDAQSRAAAAAQKWQSEQHQIHAHNAELLRSQLNNTAAPAMRHADNSGVRLPDRRAHGVHLADGARVGGLASTFPTADAHAPPVTPIAPPPQLYALVTSPDGTKSLQPVPALPAAPAEPPVQNVHAAAGILAMQATAPPPTAGGGRFGGGSGGRDGRQANRQRDLGARVRQAVAYDAKQPMRLMDKPAIAYSEILDQAMLDYLHSEGIYANNWDQHGTLPCKLCLRQDHLFNRCPRVWYATEKGRAFKGIDNAARAVRDAMASRGVTAPQAAAVDVDDDAALSCYYCACAFGGEYDAHEVDDFLYTGLTYKAAVQGEDATGASPPPPPTMTMLLNADVPAAPAPAPSE